MKLQNKFKHIIISLGTALFLLAGLFLLVGVTSIHPALAQGSIIFVDVDAPDSPHDGLSWTTAFTNVQDALNAASPGDEIWVAEGAYYPDEGAGQINNVPTSTFVLTSGVTLYGGFAATETLRTERNWDTHVTVLSGDVDGNDTIDANGVVIRTGHITGTNAYHVVTADSVVTESVVLDGFTITAGSAANTDPDKHGAGMYNNGGSPGLANLTFRGNLASKGRGGGLYNNGGSLALSNVTFNQNQAAKRGGGMYNEGGNSTLINVAFSKNDALDGGGVYNKSSASTLITVTFSNNAANYGSSWYRGGGMHNTGSDLTLTNVTFSNNTGYIGGGMYNYNSQAILSNVTFNDQSATAGGGMYNNASTLTFTDVTFSDNLAKDGGGMINVGCQRHLTFTNVVFTRNQTWGGNGGGIVNSASHPTLTNVIFRKNKAKIDGADTGYGGGIYNASSSAPTLINVIFDGNGAARRGGGIYNASSSSTLVNTTFYSNTARIDGGGIYNYYSNLVVSNSILWNNTPNQIVNTDYSTSTVTYSLMQGAAVYTGTGNVNSNPLFVDADGPDDVVGTDDDDLRLQAASPAIDAGNNDALPADTLDLDNDGNTTERIPIDLDGNPRLLGAAVDMGVYEFPAPFLTLHKSIMPARVIPYHGIVTYTLSLTNVGVLSDTVTLTDTLPAGAVFGGWVNEPSGTIRSGGAITWTGTVTTGEAVTLAFTATHTGDYGDTITNTAYFSGTGQIGSSAATFAVNQFPLANAGPDQTITRGSLAQLNGSGSSDPDGHALTYSWTQTGGSPQMVLNDSAVVSPTFTADTIGTFTFTLAVTDSLDLADPTPDSVVVTVIEDQKMVYLPLVLKNAP